MVAAAMMAATNLQAQKDRTEDFKAKYELKEVVVMSRIREELANGNRYYTLSGALANASSRGIIIGNGKKTIR